jgi:dienelactone hydrolase
MIRTIIGALAMIVLVACGAPAATAPGTAAPSAALPVPTATALPTAAPPNIQGTTAWAGAITYADGATEAIIVNLTETGGTLAIQPQNPPLTIAELRRTATSLDFTVAGKQPIHLTASVDGAALSGQAEVAGRSGALILLPLQTPDAQALAPFPGSYRFESGAALSINPAPAFSGGGLDFFWPGLALNDFRDGAIRGLYPVGPDTFLVGSKRAIGYPFAAQISFERDQQGAIAGLLWQSRDAAGTPGAGERARRLAVTSETVRYPSTDGITLTGLLTRPETPGPHPAIVVLHGSEQGTRDDFGRQQMSAFLASQGFAVLTYDKRGVGDSGGRYVEAASAANLALLADDALAGVAYLKGIADIDQRRIGLIGFSQAGWIIPLAASRSTDVGFFIILSGPTVSTGIEDRYSSYTNDGDSPARYSSAEIAQLLADVAPSGFDPAPILAQVTQPGLWLWGDQDKSVPVPESVEVLKALIAQGQTQFSYRVLPSADHNLQQPTQGLFAEIPYAPGFQADYYPALAAWLQEQAQR